MISINTTNLNLLKFLAFMLIISGLLLPAGFAVSEPVTQQRCAEALSSSDLEALKTIAERKGIMRLSYDSSSDTWSYFGSSYLTKFIRFIQSKGRFDIIDPLEALASRIENGSCLATQLDPESFHLLRRAYSSLSSLYSFYKINPSESKEKQSAFINRFSMVLKRIKSVLGSIKDNSENSRLYKPLPWYGEIGQDVHDGDRDLGLYYIDMGKRGLAELNSNLRNLGNKKTTIDRAMEFYPREKKSLFALKTQADVAKKYVIFIIHGTFAAGSKEYSDDSNLLFQQTKAMAQSFADNLNFAVEVYSIGWSGANDNEHRMVAGEELANFVQTYFPSEEYHDIYIGHSHGGNVALHTAKTFREYRTPYMIVTLATPIRKDFITDNVNYLFQFYTDSDWIQYLGSFEVTNRNGQGTGNYSQNYRLVTRDDINALGLFSHNDRYENAKINATRVRAHEKALPGAIASHSEMKYLIPILPAVIDRIVAFGEQSHLVLDLDAILSTSSSVRLLEDTQFRLSPHAT